MLQRIPVRALPALAAVVAAAHLAAAPQAPAPVAAPFSVVEATIPEMQAAMASGRTTSVAIVREYLTRLGLYQATLHAALTVNPRALDEAAARDRERADGRVRGPLHGIPVALKDNILTRDLPTTGGALAFDGFVPPYDATLVTNLRAAGAVIIAKTVMTELANWVAGAPTPMPGNYSAVGGFGFNPYDPRRDPRPDTFDGRPAMGTGGSSSGIGTTANLWAANVGTETSGSILTPSNQTMLVGVKPTVGRVSRAGVIPITADQDTAGPMARHVVDAAILLGALEGERPDAADPASRACPRPDGGDYTRALRADALRGARIGIPRAYFYDRVKLPGDRGSAGGLNAAERAAMDRAIAAIRAAGAVIVDPADLPSVVAPEPGDNLLLWNTCSGEAGARARDEDCSVVLKYGMKRDFNAWLATLGPSAPVHSLTELREWNRAHERAGAIRYGQAQLDISDEMDVVRDRARDLANRARDLRLSARTGIDAVMRAERLDALLFPGSRGAAVSAKAGYPTVIVPAGFVPNAPTPPFPAEFDAKPQPFGVSFAGAACSEPTLLGLAYAFEQATHARVPPPTAP